MGALPEPAEINPCFLNSETSQGVWYRYVGEGFDVQLSLSSSDFATVVRVYSGDCDATFCIQKNGPYSTYGSSLIWSAEAGEPYMILISGENLGDTGAFSLELVVSSISTMCL